MSQGTGQLWHLCKHGRTDWEVRKVDWEVRKADWEVRKAGSRKEGVHWEVRKVGSRKDESPQTTKS